jgi:hypothetical protein
VGDVISMREWEGEGASEDDWRLIGELAGALRQIDAILDRAERDGSYDGSYPELGRELVEAIEDWFVKLLDR